MQLLCSRKSQTKGGLGMELKWKNFKISRKHESVHDRNKQIQLIFTLLAYITLQRNTWTHVCFILGLNINPRQL